MIFHRIARNVVQRVTGNNVVSILLGKAVCDLRQLCLQVAILVVICRAILTISSHSEGGGAKVVAFGKEGIAARRGGDALARGADDVPLMPGKGHRLADGGPRRLGGGAHAWYQPDEQAQGQQGGEKFSS